MLQSRSINGALGQPAVINIERETAVLAITPVDQILFLSSRKNIYNMYNN